MQNDTPNDLESSQPVELMAIRRVRDALREVDGALAQVEAMLAGTPAISRESIARSACLALGELGEVSHEVRREILSMFGLYPW
jgi:hypothetical protein